MDSDELFLTKIVPNLRGKGVQRDMRDAHQLHRTVMSLFETVEEASPRSELGVLHRIDTTRTGPIILIQSRHLPDLEKLPELYGSTSTTSLGNLFEYLHDGISVRYKITVNFTKDIRTETGQEKRVALGKKDLEIRWKNTSDSNGLLTNPDQQRMTPTTIRGKKNNGTLILRPWEIEGTATISDLALLSQVIKTGIGRGRAYGCGLLTLAPL